MTPRSYEERLWETLQDHRELTPAWWELEARASELAGDVSECPEPGSPAWLRAAREVLGDDPSAWRDELRVLLVEIFEVELP